jgi:hypothetical protein
MGETRVLSLPRIFSFGSEEHLNLPHHRGMSDLVHPAVPSNDQIRQIYGPILARFGMDSVLGKSGLLSCFPFLLDGSDFETRHGRTNAIAVRSSPSVVWSFPDI